MPRYLTKTSAIIITIASLVAVLIALIVPAHLWLVAGFVAYCAVASGLSLLFADELEAEDLAAEDQEH